MAQVETDQKPLLRVQYDVSPDADDYKVTVDQEKGAQFFLANGLTAEQLQTLSLLLTDRDLDIGDYSDYNPKKRIISLNLFYLDLRIGFPMDAHPNDEFLDRACEAIDDILPKSGAERWKRRLLTGSTITAGSVALWGAASIIIDGPSLVSVGEVAGGNIAAITSMSKRIQIGRQRLGLLLQKSKHPRWQNIVTMNTAPTNQPSKLPG